LHFPQFHVIMTQMRISAEEARRRLASQDNLVRLADQPCEHIKGMKRETPDGKPKVPHFIQETAAILAEMPGANQGEIGRGLGVSRQEVTACKAGLPGNLQEKNKQRHELIKDAALRKLMLSLNLISEDNLKDLGPKDLASVSVSMSKVHQTFSPDAALASAPNLIIYSPVVKTEERYKTIDV